MTGTEWKQMKSKDLPDIEIREEHIKTTIERAKGTFYQNQSIKVTSYQEFLFAQFGYIEKRWWFYQSIIMTFLLIALTQTNNNPKMWKETAILIPLFVVMIIPELWKSKRCHTMEVENSSYFSLRQIYSTRMILFAMVDFTLLSLFFMMASITLKITIWDMIIQFMLPFLVTCCICFRVLCSKKFNSEFTAVILCLFWSAVWTLIVINQKLYLSVAKPIWIILITFSVVYLWYAVKKTLKNCVSCMEEEIIWNLQ